MKTSCLIHLVTCSALAASCSIAAPLYAAPMHDMHDMHDMKGMEDMDDMDGKDMPAPAALPSSTAPPAAVNRILPAPATAVPVFADPNRGVDYRNMFMPEAQARIGFTADHLEYALAQQHGAQYGVGAWDIDAWVGGNLNRFVVRSEGETGNHGTDAWVEGLYSRAISPFWNGRVGLRQDFGDGPNRQWLALGVKGFAPYWIDTELMLYAGPAGRTAFFAQAEYDARLTQRLILTPEIEMNAYGRTDAARAIGAGLSDVVTSLRLRYEFTRQVAPYIGVEWHNRFGRTAALARDDGDRASVVRVVAGVKLWF